MVSSGVKPVFCKKVYKCNYQTTQFQAPQPARENKYLKKNKYENGSLHGKAKRAVRRCGKCSCFPCFVFQFELVLAQPLLIILKGDNEVRQFWIYLW